MADYLLNVDMLEQSWNPIQEYIFKWYPILAKSKVLASIPNNQIAYPQSVVSQ